MSTELIVNASLPETRIALMEDGEIQELLIERASGKGIVGNIYKGRVTRVLPGMQAAFVDIGLEKAAFLYVDDVYVHSEIWEEEEGGSGDLPMPLEGSESGAEGQAPLIVMNEGQQAPSESGSQDDLDPAGDAPLETPELDDFESLDDEDDEDDDHDEGPVGMEGDDRGGDHPPGTVAPGNAGSGSSGGESGGSSGGDTSGSGSEGFSGPSLGAEGGQGGEGGQGESAESREGRRHRRGRRGGRNRRRRGGEREGAEGQVQGQGQGQQQQGRGRGPQQVQAGAGAPVDGSAYPEHYLADDSDDSQDRTEMDAGQSGGHASERPEQGSAGEAGARASGESGQPGAGTARMPVDTTGKARPEFRETRSRDRRIKPKEKSRPVRGQVNIQDLLHEGQEVLVQVAKDPIATKGARLTCHISLPGRHLVCMPTIDHVGVSRRIERDDERRRLRDFVEKNRPKNLGFIVRTASGKNQSEKRLKQDIDYLARLWTEIREKSANVTAPALVYEDLNAVLRAIRDWVTEEIDKIIVDSRYHFNEMQRFVSHFMPSLKQKVELYHGDVPIFDAYNISTELSRALERKVWLKSGGYLVIDQAEALVAIDVNTGRYVGKKNLEDTILKTNLEAVQEIAYQLRLRNCGGMIILDLIDMEKEENKQRVYRAFDDALKKDRARPSILKISELGLIEMTRKRTRDTIIRTLCESCPHCEGKGFIKSKQTTAYEIMREIERDGIERDVTKILIQAHSEVIDVLAIEERETVDQLERRYRKPIFLQTVGDFHPEQFEVIAEKREGATIETSRRTNRPSGIEASGSGSRDGNRGRGRGGSRERNDKNRNQQGGGGRRPAPVTATSGMGDGPAPVILNRPIQPIEGGLDRAAADAGMAQYEGRTADSFESEEDRLAFLRAQAAQDAALARLGGSAAGQGQNRTATSGTQGAPGGQGGRDRGERGGADRGERGGRRRRGRGGRGRNRDRDRAPSGQPSAGPRPIGSGPVSAGPAGSGEGQSSAPSGGGSSGGDSHEGGSSGGSSGGEGGGRNDGGDNGGGDHSNPPN